MLPLLLFGADEFGVDIACNQYTPVHPNEHMSAYKDGAKRDRCLGGSMSIKAWEEVATNRRVAT